MKTQQQATTTSTNDNQQTLKYKFELENKTSENITTQQHNTKQPVQTTNSKQYTTTK